MAKQDQPEVEFITDRIVEKIWQGHEAKRALSRQTALVALAAIQDYTETLYMETADEFTGEQLRQRWLIGRELL